MTTRGFIHLSTIVSFVSTENCLENSEDNVLSSEREESPAPESYDTNDEIECEELESDNADIDNSGEDAGPYSRELLADDEWLREYYREREIIEENEPQLQNRLDRVVEINTLRCLCRYGRLERLLLFFPPPPDFVF